MNWLYVVKRLFCAAFFGGFASMSYIVGVEMQDGLALGVAWFFFVVAAGCLLAVVGEFLRARSRGKSHG